MVADAVILAGGSSKGLAEVPSKGMVPINGRPMVEYVIDALRACPEIDRICIVMPSGIERDWRSKADIVVSSDGSLTDNVATGIASLKSNRMVIVLSCDIPLVSPESISDFLRRCEGGDAKLYYPIIPESVAKARFPNMRRTYVKTREGKFTGGNLILVDPLLVETGRDLMEDAYAMRKSPFKLAKRLGFRFIVGLLAGNLSVSQAERRVSDLLESPVKAVVTPFGEIGLDVDKESDLQIISAYFEGNSNQAAN